MSSQPHDHHIMLYLVASHASEHSSFSNICFTAINRSTGQTTHARRPGLDHSNTRIQMHQNLFTLTKNISAPRQLAWEANIRHSSPQTFAGIADQNNRNSITPCNSCTPTNPVKTKTGGDGRNRTDDPLLAKQVLYQLSYIP
jgi:hypothetical protein